MRVVNSTTVSVTPEELNKICMNWGNCEELGKIVARGEHSVYEGFPCSICPLSLSGNRLYNRQIVFEVVNGDFTPFMRKRTDGVIEITSRGVCKLCRVINAHGLCRAYPFCRENIFPYQFSMVIEQ